MKKAIAFWGVILLAACTAESITHTPEEQPKPQVVETVPTLEQHITIHSEDIITGFEIPFREEEIDLMARVVQAEYGNGDELDKRLVVAVILNRLEDEDFPNSIYKVVTQPNQFAIDTWASVECFSAVYAEIRNRTDREILWFNAGGYSKYGVPAYQYNDHYFSRKKREGEH